MGNNKLYKTLLTSIQQACLESEGIPFNNELIEKISPKVEPLASFFSINSDEAIVLAFILQSAFKDTDINMDVLIGQFGQDITGIADVQEIISTLKDAGLVYTKNSSRGRRRLTFKNVSANPKVITAITEGDISVMDYQAAETFGYFLKDIAEVIYQRYHEIIDTEKLVNEIDRIIKINLHLPEVSWIDHQHDLKGVDLAIFLDITIEHSIGEEEVDMDKMLKEVIDDVFDRTKYKHGLKNTKTGLLATGHVVPAGDFFSIFNLVQLGEAAMNKLFGTIQEVNGKPFSPKMGHLINHEEVTEEKLCYNKREKEQIDTLCNALNEEHYLNIRKKMINNGMCPGLTVLMHGYPGTGKTSTVKRVAKQTGRHIYMVDVPKINSKWVGESEKNLSRVFEEYKKAKKHFKCDPILLFNEADALLGKRFNVNNSVDKMNNSLQNILLQELEDFDGIFIATTNLADHLDSAFDRRFLYKIEFKKPEDAVRIEILNHAFPDIDQVVLSEINQQFMLTGGQIANIKKKLLIKGMLEEGFDTQDELITLCEEEFSLHRGTKRNSIGFQIPRAN